MEPTYCTEEVRPAAARASYTSIIVNSQRYMIYSEENYPNISAPASDFRDAVTQWHLNGLSVVARNMIERIHVLILSLFCAAAIPARNIIIIGKCIVES